MNKKESENPKARGPFLSKEAGKELRLRGAKTMEIAAKTRKTLERIMPPYSGHLIIK